MLKFGLKKWVRFRNSLKPQLLSTAPPNRATDVPPNGNVSATFDMQMDPTSINAETFTLTSGAARLPVQGRVTYANNKAIFWPAAPLESNCLYTAMITTGAKSALGVALARHYPWSFTTGANQVPGLP